MPPSIHPDQDAAGWVSTWLGVDEVWVAESQGIPVGYARCTSAWLDDLYVAPSAAGQGVGSALLDTVKARRQGGFCLWVFEVNEPARRFYRARGLLDLERTDGDANDEREPDIRMCWPGVDPVGFLRGLIDEVDTELGDLLNRRAALTSAVQPHKFGADRDRASEREIVRALAARAPTLGEHRLARIVHAIIAESLDARRDD